MPVTQAEIAKKLGISIASVSHVLNGREHLLGKETVKKIRLALKEANYTQNPLARALRGGKTGIIGVYVHELLGASSMLLNLFDSLAYQKGYRVVTFNRAARTEKDWDVIREAKSFRVEGLIVLGRWPKREEKEITGKKTVKDFPMVDIRGFGEFECPSIYSDYSAALEKLMNHLLDLGHRHMAFPFWDRTEDINNICWQGIQSAYRKKGLPLPADDDFYTLVPGEYQNVYEAGEITAQAILQKRKNQPAEEKYTAIVTPSNHVALGVFRALTDHGLKVPGDVSVASCYGNVLDAGISSPRLTMISQPLKAMAQNAFDMLMQQIESKDKTESRVLPMKLEVHESTGPVPVLSDTVTINDKNIQVLSPRRSKLIGVYSAHFRRTYQNRLFSMIDALAYQNDFRVIAINGESKTDDDWDLIEEADSFRLDGLITLFRHRQFDDNSKIPPKRKVTDLPIVDLFGYSDFDCPIVDIDRAGAMESLMNHLFDLGHRNIAFAAFGRARSLEKLNWQGVQTAYQKRGLPIPSDDDFFPPFSGFKYHIYQAGAESCRAILQKRELQSDKDKYTAIVSISDGTAIGVIQHLTDQGLKVPGDISVAGFGSFFEGDLVRPRLTTPSWPLPKMAQTAFDMLMQQIKDKTVPDSRILPMDLTVRESTGPVPLTTDTIEITEGNSQVIQTRRSGLIGVYVANMKENHQISLFSMIDALAYQNDFRIVTINGESKTDDNWDLIDEANSFRLKGLITLYRHRQFDDNSKIAPKRATDLPMVDLLGYSDFDCPTVGIDRAGGMESLMNHLFDLGHRNIAFAAFGRTRSVEKLLWQAIQAAYLKKGLSPPGDEDFHPPFSGFSQRLYGAGEETAYNIIEKYRLQSDEEKYTAIVAMNDTIAFSVIKILEDHGLKVPQDISVIGFGHSETSEVLVKRITTIAWPIENLAQTAFEMLMQQIKDKAKPQSQVLPMELVIRKSTAPPPSKTHAI